MKYVLFALLAYVVYQFIFRLVIPVYLASKKIKKGFRDMQDRMQQNAGQQQGFTPQSTEQKSSPSSSKKDYIDFEEIR